MTTAAERVFQLSVPRPAAEPSLTVPLEHGEALFVVGANGTGKSSLLHHLSRQAAAAKHIVAYRQTALPGSTVGLTAERRAGAKEEIVRYNSQEIYRWRDPYGETRLSSTLFDLANHENMRARAVVRYLDAGKSAEAEAERVANLSAIDQINEIFAKARFGVSIDLIEGDRFVARRPGGVSFDMEQMSDGERAAALLTADVITADSGTLILIDEPERHLHRSISVPLLCALFDTRDDCAFVIATHDIDLPATLGSRTILLSGCTFDADGGPAAWLANLVPSDNFLSEEIKRDILGARRAILFVEGEGTSLDHALYRVLFPEFAVVPKGSFKDVQAAVKGLRSTEDLNWLHAFGIVDRDQRNAATASALLSSGTYALPVSAVESVYYHPIVQKLVAPRMPHCDDVEGMLATARAAILESSRHSLDDWARRRVEQDVRQKMLDNIPGRQHIENGVQGISPDQVSSLISQERKKLTELIQSENAAAIIEGYPIKKSSVLDRIAESFGLRGRKEYEGAVIGMLESDQASADSVRQHFFAGLTTAIRTQH